MCFGALSVLLMSSLIQLPVRMMVPIAAVVV